MVPKSVVNQVLDFIDAQITTQLAWHHKDVVAVALASLKTFSPSLLAKNGGPITERKIKDAVRYLCYKKEFVSRKGTKNGSPSKTEKLKNVTDKYVGKISKIIDKYHIHPAMIVSSDEIGIFFFYFAQ